MLIFKRRFLAIFFLSQFLSIGLTSADDKTSKLIFPKYLEGNEPSYFAYVPDEEKSENHLEFYVSVRYPIADNLVGKNKKLFFVYNGLYDFYLSSRFSSPIISRKQNPGVMFKHKLKSLPVLEYYKLSWFHESNGQNIESKDVYDVAENASDHVSRGWDYLGLDLKWSLTKTLNLHKKDLYLNTNFRFFCDCQALGFIDREDDVFWQNEPPKKQPDVHNYDGLRTVLTYTFPINNKISAARISAQYRFGTSDLDALTNVSQKYELTMRIVEFPLTLFYFNGYGKNLSQYHVKDEYIAIGVELW